jgi:hypothetical protein
MKSASPIPRGARKVALCFSAASMKMQKMSSKVRNASMNKPRATDVFADKVVRTASGPGNKAATTAAALIPARSCVTMRRIALTNGTAPMRLRATVTYVEASVKYSFEPVSRTNRRVEQSAADAKEDPNIDCQGEAEG